MEIGMASASVDFLLSVLSKLFFCARLRMKLYSVNFCSVRFPSNTCTYNLFRAQLLNTEAKSFTYDPSGEKPVGSIDLILLVATRVTLYRSPTHLCQILYTKFWGSTVPQTCHHTLVEVERGSGIVRRGSLLLWYWSTCYIYEKQNQSHQLYWFITIEQIRILKATNFISEGVSVKINRQGLQACVSDLENRVW